MICEAPASNTGSKISYSDWIFSWFSSAHTDKTEIIGQIRSQKLYSIICIKNQYSALHCTYVFWLWYFTYVFRLAIRPSWGWHFCYTNTAWSNVPDYSTILKLLLPLFRICRSQWPRGLRRRSAAARLLRSWVRIPPGAWMFVCCECCVSGRGLCDELITRPEESYRLWCVVVCDIEKPQEWGGHDPRWVAAPQKKKFRICGPELLSRYSDSQRDGRSGDQIPVGARFPAPVQTGSGAHPASYTVGTGSFPRVQRPGRDVDHPTTPI